MHSIAHGGAAAAFAGGLLWLLTPPFPLTGLAWFVVALDLARRPRMTAAAEPSSA